MQTVFFKKVDPQDQFLLEQIYRHRFQVYVHQCNFLKSEHFPDGTEFDEFDGNSTHFAAVNAFGEVIGSVRMIRKTRKGTQIDKYQPHLKINPKHFEESYAEISRFVIGKELSRPNKLWTAESAMDQRAVKSYRLSRRGLLNFSNPIAFGLYEKIIEECTRLDIVNIFALMEERLAKMLKRSGISFVNVGQTVDIYGPVKPYMGSIKEIKQAIRNYHFPPEYTKKIKASNTSVN